MARKESVASISRLLYFFGISVVLSVFSLQSVSLKLFERSFVKSTCEDLEHVSTGIMSTFKAWRDSLKGDAQLIAGLPDVRGAVRKRDDASLKKLLDSFSKVLHVPTMLFTDNAGVIISASDNFIQAGENIAALKAVKRALSNDSSMSYETIGSLPFAEIYASPVREADGSVIGTCVIVYSLTEKTFIELLSEYGVEGTVFRGDKRVASTLPNVTGTILDNPKIKQQVLYQGRNFVGRVKIRDVDYYSVYSPFQNEDGTVAGMLFVAKRMRSIKAVTSAIRRVLIPLCLIITVLLTALLVQRTVHDRRKLRQKVTQLGKQVDWDTLTGANTRQFGMDELEHSFHNFLRGFSSPAIMLLDVDNFKSINDTYGHEAGDIVLKQLVQTVYGECRTSDKIIRWGGDEFVGIFEGMRREVCSGLAENVLKAVSSTQFVFDGKTAKVTVSIGFSYFRTGDNGYEDAVARADDALYQSKANGKNTCSIKV
ncbi:MAG: diguanylate cyclase [Treponema sp.]|nr:diguanylate cyclase [Treponema sp.]